MMFFAPLRIVQPPPEHIKNVEKESAQAPLEKTSHLKSVPAGVLMYASLGSRHATSELSSGNTLNSRYPVFKVATSASSPGQSEIVQYLPSSSTASGVTLLRQRPNQKRTKSAAFAQGICLRILMASYQNRKPLRRHANYGPFPSTHDC